MNRKHNPWRITSAILALVMLLALGIPGLQYQIQSASAAEAAWGPFAGYYAANGGLRQHGLALSGPVCMQAENGVYYTTQFFERSVFEHHTEFAGTANEVLLKRVGASAWEDRQLKGAYTNGACGAAGGKGDGGVKPPVNQGAYPGMRGPQVPKAFPYDLAGYDPSFEYGDYEPNKVDVPQYYWRVITSGTVQIPGLVNCEAEPNFGCLVLIINHFGPTANWTGAYVDSGFSGAGRVWDMGGFQKPVTAAQALLDHYSDAMTNGQPGQGGANCGVTADCRGVKYFVIIVGDGVKQAEFTGRFSR